MTLLRNGIEVVYNLDPIPYTKACVFLAGPTPRSSLVPSWRHEALNWFQMGHPDVRPYLSQMALILPEGEDGTFHGNGDAQNEWEYRAIEACDVLAFWIPRSFGELPGFTTNVEFGLWLDKPRVVYGRPDHAKKILYLDWLFRKRKRQDPCTQMKAWAEEVFHQVRLAQEAL